MKADIALLKADIIDEMDKIKKVCNEFSPLIDKLKLSEEEIGNYDKAVIGYLMHNFYGGCENIFRSIARFFENEVSSQSWHKDLLKRMTLDIEGFRPKVVSEKLFLLLDDFRGFRHKFRYSYSFELDWEREKVVAKRLMRTWEMLNSEVELFLKKLDSISEE